MSDGLSLGIVAGVAAQEGIKFLYGQIAELLKRSRERKAARVAGGRAGVIREPELVSVPPPGVFDQAPAELRIPVDSITGYEGQVDALLRRVAGVSAANGQASSADFLQAVRDLRALLESLSGQRLQFAGEPKEERAILRLDATIGVIGEHAKFVGIDIGSAGAKSADATVTIDRIDGDVVVVRQK